VVHAKEVTEKSRKQNFERRLKLQELLDHKQALAESLRRALLIFKTVQAQHATGEDADREEKEENALFEHFQQVLKFEKDQIEKEANREALIQQIRDNCAAENQHAKQVRLEHLFHEQPHLFDALKDVLKCELQVQQAIDHTLSTGQSSDSLESLLRDEENLRRAICNYLEFPRKHIQ
jgi:hypothetical protein